MIPIFELTPEQKTELETQLKTVGDFDPLHPATHLGVILRFHEDIYIRLLMGEMGED